MKELGVKPITNHRVIKEWNSLWSGQLFISLINQLNPPKQKKENFLLFDWISLIVKEMKWNEIKVL